MAHERAYNPAEDQPRLLPAYPWLILNNAREVSRKACRRLQELHRQFPFQQSVLAAFQKAGVELGADAEGPLT